MFSLRMMAAIATVVGLAAAGAGSAYAVSPGTYRVTMLTGDRMVLTVADDGTESVTATGSTTSDGVFRSWHAEREDGDVYAYPVELMPYVDRLLDRELFNVTKLVEQGLADRESGSIPLIVEYERSARGADLPAAVTRSATLESIDAVAGRQSKSRARRLGDELREQFEVDRGALRRGRASELASSGPLAGIERIYLDERVEAALAQSVPQIGAPQAWAAGLDGAGVDVAVLDTGADTTHPDLQGKVVAQQNFTSEPTAGDGNGHGTHVAATVAGTGQGSGGLRRGVAPGARLMNGKVLRSNGSGPSSWTIAGMEWAAGNGAEIVSLSLEGGPSDGNDLISQAVNRLTESTGVLFTIAAGNLGVRGPGSVTSPGAADRALTVGAVDKSDVLAGFSGRGPRLGNLAIKPDVTAPGVGIVAARAAGTSLGTPVDDRYTMLDGTSMATPHVAGAAAILKQKHPTWTADQIKAALVSTAAPAARDTVFQQGGGRVDVARAYSQEVYSLSGPVNLGFFRWPHVREPVRRSITYSNESAADVTLNLAAEVRDQAGNPGPAGMVSVGSPSVTVPAGATVSVGVTLDTRVGGPGTFGGYVVARSADGTVVVRTPIGFYKEPESYDLRLDAVARDGRPAYGISWINVMNVDDPARFEARFSLSLGPGTVRVPAGTYSVMGTLFTDDARGVYAEELTLAGDPQLEVTQDTTFVADARGALEIAADTDRRTEVKRAVVGPYRAGERGAPREELTVVGPPVDRFFAKPTEQVTKGDFGFRTKLRLAAPTIEATVTRPETIPLDVRMASGSALLDGTEQRDLVYVGLGRPEDYQGRNVRGKAVLITGSGGGNALATQKVADATAAGAAAVIFHNDRPGLLRVTIASSEIPVLTTSLSQGELLQDLLEDGPVRVRLRGVPQSPYTYDVLFEGWGRIPDHPLRRTVDATNSYRLNIDYRAHVDGFVGGAVRHGFPTYSRFTFDAVENFRLPFTRTEYVNGGAAWQPIAYQVASPGAYGRQQAPIESYPARGTGSEDWFGQPQAPGVVRELEVGAEDGQPVTRHGNTIDALVREWMDPAGRFGATDSRVDSAEFRLYENGELIANNATGFRGSFTVGSEPALYRAELDLRRRAPWWRWSSDTETAWTFRSAPTSGAESLPLLFVDYDLGRLDMLNRAPRGPYEIDLRVRRQPGAPAAAVTDMRVWASLDDGGTWRPLDLDERGGGNYTARLTHPNRQSDQHVSLRVQASDAGGSRVTQTIMRAYGLQ